MPAISIDITGDHEAFARRVGYGSMPTIHTAEDWEIDAIALGMSSGATALMVAIPARVNGAEVVVLAETSLNAWMMASAALAAAHRSEVEQPGWARLNDEARQVLIPRYAEACRRSIPELSSDRALELAEMLLDALSAGGPVEELG